MKMSAPDLAQPSLNSPDLPPGELASLGSKRVCNPREIQTFKTLKGNVMCRVSAPGIGRFPAG